MGDEILLMHRSTSPTVIARPKCLTKEYIDIYGCSNYHLVPDSLTVIRELTCLSWTYSAGKQGCPEVCKQGTEERSIQHTSRDWVQRTSKWKGQRLTSTGLPFKRERLQEGKLPDELAIK